MSEDAKAQALFKWYLTSSNQTYTSFAEKLGINRNTVRRWVSGESTPNKHHLSEIFRLSGIKPGEWFEKADNFSWLRRKTPPKK